MAEFGKNVAWKWTRQREKAAKLAADDALTNEQIAASVGVTRQAVDYWRKEPEFQARVAGIVADYAEAIKAEGIANVKNRVAALNRDFDATETIIAERAVSPEMRNAPGGKTGRVVRTLKMLGSGEFGREVEEFAYDGGLIQSRMALLRQASQELGQWTEKREDKQTVEVLVREYVGVDLGRLTGKARDEDSLPPAGGGAVALP